MDNNDALPLDRLFQPNTTPTGLEDPAVAAILRRAVQILPSEIQEEYRRLPGEVAYAGMLLAEAERAQREAELDARMVTARRALTIRAELEMRGQKVTEGLVAANLESDSQWQDAQVREIARRADRARIKAVCDALDAKRDMLISYGAHVRQEMRPDPIIRDPR